MVVTELWLRFKNKDRISLSIGVVTCCWSVDWIRKVHGLDKDWPQGGWAALNMFQSLICQMQEPWIKSFFEDNLNWHQNEEISTSFRYLGFYLLSVLNFFSLLWPLVWTLNRYLLRLPRSLRRKPFAVRWNGDLSAFLDSDAQPSQKSDLSHPTFHPTQQSMGGSVVICTQLDGRCHRRTSATPYGCTMHCSPSIMFCHHVSTAA